MDYLIIISIITVASLGVIWYYSDQIKTRLGLGKKNKPVQNTQEKQEQKDEKEKDQQKVDKKDYIIVDEIAIKKADNDLIMKKTQIWSGFKQFCCDAPSKLSIVLETIYNTHLSSSVNSAEKYGIFNKNGPQQLKYPISDYESDQKKGYIELFRQIEKFNILTVEFDKLNIPVNGFLTDLWSNAKFNDSEYKYDSSQLIQSLIGNITQIYKNLQSGNTFIIFFQQPVQKPDMKIKLYSEIVEVDDVSYQLTAFNVKNKQNDALAIVKDGNYIVFDNYCRNNIQNEEKHFPENDKSAFNAIGSVTGQFVKIIKLEDINYLIVTVANIRV